MKIVLYRGPLDGQVKMVNENNGTKTLTFNYMPKRKRGARGVYWNNVSLANADIMNPDLTFRHKVCMYRLVEFYDPQTRAKFPAMRPDGAVFYEWTDARKDNNLRGPFNRYQRY